MRFCAELFSSTLLRGILPRAPWQELFIYSLLQRNFLCTFSQVLFPWFFLRVDSFFFRGSVLPCSFLQRRYPLAHPPELFPCAFLQWFFLCSLRQGRLPWDSSQAFLRALFLRAFIPRTLLQHRFPWAHQRLIFRTLLCCDFLRALFRLRYFPVSFPAGAFSVRFSAKAFP